MSSANSPLAALNKYQIDISNMRSHHWKYWIDLYSNCYYNCVYCVYRKQGKMGKIKSHPERLDALERELPNITQKGIVYLGPRADIYQPLERRELLARRSLELFYENSMPVFLVTRSELILRDIDILKKLANKGLIEVSVTIPSLRSIQLLEPHTPSIDRRLELVRTLRMEGVATSVHMSPIIPGLDDIHDLERLLDQCGEVNADCIYACMLGVTDAFYERILSALTQESQKIKEAFQKAFPDMPAEGSLVSAPNKMIVHTMSKLSHYATIHGLPFACVHIPSFDTLERCGGIFRYKLPTIGDIIRHFDRISCEFFNLSNLLDFIRSYPAVEDEFLFAVEEFWTNGVLFRNTPFRPRRQDGIIQGYVRESGLDINVSNMRVV